MPSIIPFHLPHIGSKTILPRLIDVYHNRQPTIKITLKQQQFTQVTCTGLQAEEMQRSESLVSVPLGCIFSLFPTPKRQITHG